MNIFFDLDGTLLDVSRRYYKTHIKASKKINKRPLSFNRYWEEKRKKTPEWKILNLSSNNKLFKIYEKERINCLEKKSFLKFDQPFHWVYKLLALLKIYNLYILTLRRNRINLKFQIKKFGLDNLFEETLSEAPLSDPVSTKIKLLKKNKLKFTDLLIGDTEVDIAAAKRLGIISVAVCSGIRNRNFLKQSNPDFLVKDASEFFKKVH